LLADIQHNLANMQALLHPLMRPPGVLKRVDHVDHRRDAKLSGNIGSFRLGREKSALPGVIGRVESPPEARKMATLDQIPTDLTLALGDDLSPEEFVAAVRNFFGYINEIAQSQEGDGSEVSWVVKVKEGSSLIGLDPSASTPPSRLAMIYEKARHAPMAVARGDLVGAGLSDKAIGHLKALSELADRHGDHQSVNLWVNREPINIGSGIAKRVQADWDTGYYDTGTIEGRLETISDANGGIRIRIKDYLYPKAINCIVPEKMVQQVLSSFRRRVEVDGKIHYRRDGTPISIEAMHIDVLPEDHDLPSASDVRGIMAVA
jgi:hypothetical protein